MNRIPANGNRLQNLFDNAPGRARPVRIRFLRFQIRNLKGNDILRFIQNRLKVLFGMLQQKRIGILTLRQDGNADRQPFRQQNPGRANRRFAPRLIGIE